MTYDDLFDLLFAPRTVLFVMSQATANDLSRKRAFSSEHIPPMPSEQLWGVPLRAFADVPDNEVVVFFDADAARAYMWLRVGVGHAAAIARLRAAVAPEMVQQTTLAALLEQARKPQ